jgi:hypothetical protein
MRWGIQVTQQHINNGVPKNSSACPVAQALSLALGGEWRAGGRIALESVTGAVVFLPPEVEEFVLDFDAGKPVKPFGFTVKREE